ncbi:hypothetical protein M514_05949 [Trichuris suis]|uniref:Uncharacterized protein n=1 Tax=Trichuris suis TaxID=68888 RepID=A0A085N7V2_9BILA|nr:hypothetical protein M513_05949 [Trichuris suis]KFD65548.1 hypothetical protein M514_05949 [Trichuris suis]
MNPGFPVMLQSGLANGFAPVPQDQLKPNMMGTRRSFCFEFGGVCAVLSIEKYFQKGEQQ